VVIVNSVRCNMGDRAIDVSGSGYGIFMLPSFGRDGY